MRRSVAHAVLYFTCICGFAATNFAADLNSSWQPIGQAKIQKNIRAAVPFRPELTLEQNNQLLKDHRAKAVIVGSTVPIQNLRRIQLVNQAVQLQCDDRNFSGRVTAVALSEDEQSLTVFAEISDPQFDQQNISKQNVGLLSVEG